MNLESRGTTWGGDVLMMHCADVIAKSLEEEGERERGGGGREMDGPAVTVAVR